ncbi:MAG: hypothetical protein A2W91_13125 [Bacteroidetes bacterium GWF2_38_335]|nr:MAG: hypothetical protein A2W91_13125 [Bacteroidetes bacterium GWF2_38_335]OFY77197.1 MAG: hypothetical protein A2281_14790 [Bacteroidetes bacterium RIFOXYA12_FULL_38_20]HBS85802.1 NYN domain-containing protein [Bacteroidales bacterium]
MKNVIVYVDGFNLYFGLKSKGWKKYYWTDLVRLSNNLLKSDQKLIKTKYFTSFVSSPPDKSKRQKTYIEALESLDDIEIFYGKYQSNNIICPNCKYKMIKPNEKMTDVNIAVEILKDAFENRFETALLISADSDLAAPIKTIRNLFANKQVILAFPPDRFSFELTKFANGYFTIGKHNLKKILFPEEVKKRDGFVLKMPERWKSENI